MMGFDSHSFKHNLIVDDSRNFHSQDPQRSSLKKLKADKNSSLVLMDKLQNEIDFKSQQSIVMPRMNQNDNSYPSDERLNSQIRA